MADHVFFLEMLRIQVQESHFVHNMELMEVLLMVANMYRFLEILKVHIWESHLVQNL